MEKNAMFSKDGRYRYELTRRWEEGPRCVFIMLNPSTADASKDDPTIKRCIEFAKALDCGALHVVNLFSYRATNPREMKKASDPIGFYNDTFIKIALRVTEGPIIAAWGKHGAFRERGAQIIGRYPGRLQCLGINKDGSPKHPLYVPGDTKLQWLNSQN